MKLLRNPPKIKILEAAGCIGDKRYKLAPLLTGGARARIKSSEGTREYLVIAIPQDNGEEIIAYSNDNGTKYRGYIGYPIICLLILLGLLPRDKHAEEALKGIPWKELNSKYKKYSLVEEIVLREYVKGRGYNVERILEYREKTYRKLAELKIYYDPNLAK